MRVPERGDADVIVAGAGPGGAAAASVLARAGIRVVVVERATFPRDKTCGDGLIPDALAALDRLGVGGTVREEGLALAGARVVGPGGEAVVLGVDAVALPRERLDHLLVEAARDAGARVLEGVTVDGPLGDGDRVSGVVGHRTGSRGDRVEVRAPVTILATGAAARVLSAFGVSRRTRPHALALRRYLRVPGLDLRRLVLSYERRLLPGYAWIFPVGDGVLNVGVSRFLGRSGSSGVNLRDELERFIEASPVGRELLEGAEPAGDPRGAPLRTGLRGSVASRPGLLLAGETLGTTYAASGEGIGKALETGEAAAGVASDALRALERRGPGAMDRVLAGYPELLRARFGETHRAYRVAQRWLRFPWAVDLILRTARRDPDVAGALEAIVREDAEATRVVSLLGLLRLAGRWLRTG